MTYLSNVTFQHTESFFTMSMRSLLKKWNKMHEFYNSINCMQCWCLVWHVLVIYYGTDLHTGVLVQPTLLDPDYFAINLFQYMYR